MSDGHLAAGPLRVALDATPLLGRPTGVGAFCLGALGTLGQRPELDVRAFAVSWRRRAGLRDLVPAGVRVAQRPMPARPLHAIWATRSVPPIEWFVGPVDVVHGTNFVVPPTRRAGAVVSVHDLTPLHHPELCNEATLAYPGLIRRAVARGAWVHTDSAFVAGEVTEAFGADPDRVVVVNPGVPPLPEAPPGVARPLVARLLPPGVARYILAIGTAEPRKDLPGLVRAFDQLADRHHELALVLAGPPGWGEEALSSSVARARAGDRIVRTGWAEPALLGALLQEAAVLAFPSVYEGFGFPPLQAMAAGVPVVASRAGSLPEVLGDAALLVEVGDEDGLANALDWVLGDEALRQKLVTAGVGRAAGYTWDCCGEGLEQLYRRVAERARG
ncbi:MAG TPA: glycosyltransferase family 1 protein [Acidimicrobiales bacterium]|jgi:glycosyltransferase involved in cell wall biosynthesis|nr:glycosyltransferase family 1 protein [Acidimicrobiales bacterium]